MQFHLPLKFHGAKQKKRKVFSLRLTKKIIALYAILFTSFFICLSVYVMGGGLSESDSFKISFTSPSEGQTFTTGNILVAGAASGGVLNTVIIWDQKYNVGMYAGTGSGVWSLSIPVSQFSNGVHIICAKAQSTDGKWSHTISRTINTYPTTHTVATGYASDTIPGGILFKPAEALSRSVVALVSGGTDTTDLNGDNIQDVFQQSPITPNYNQSNIPLVMIFVLIAVVILIIVAIYGSKEYLSKRKKRMEKKLQGEEI